MSTEEDLWARRLLYKPGAVDPEDYESTSYTAGDVEALFRLSAVSSVLGITSATTVLLAVYFLAAGQPEPALEASARRCTRPVYLMTFASLLPIYIDGAIDIWEFCVLKTRPRWARKTYADACHRSICIVICYYWGYTLWPGSDLQYCKTGANHWPATKLAVWGTAAHVVTDIGAELLAHLSLGRFSFSYLPIIMIQELMYCAALGM
ncbi:hypothetical protein RQP46_001728 [Phenoliferia psychrophenolica]